MGVFAAFAIALLFPPYTKAEEPPFGSTPTNQAADPGANGVTMLWAHAASRAKVHREPDSGSPVFRRLQLTTAERFPEVYRVIEEKTDAGGTSWTRIGIPARPNGQTGWVESSALGYTYSSRSLLRISLRWKVARLWQYGDDGSKPRLVWASRVGVGARGTPTPAGRFWIRARIRNLAGSPMYGPIAFGTSAYSRLSDWPGGGVVGIHGTDQPWLIPGAISHGCIRVPNERVLRLAKQLQIGTPVEIR